jgi:hypothetical protein
MSQHEFLIFPFIITKEAHRKNNKYLKRLGQNLNLVINPRCPFELPGQLSKSTDAWTSVLLAWGLG